MTSFNLIDEPWLPCIGLEDGASHLLSLREALAQAHTLRELADPSPLNTVALHRFLLAILHRVFGPPGQGAWLALWRRGDFDMTALDAYLERWRARFDLLAEQRPFYQAVGITRDEPSDARELVHERAPWGPSGHFNHPIPFPLTLAEAARYLVGFQAFCIGGMVSLQRTEPTENKFTSGSPLLPCAVTLVTGPTLFATLLLNMVAYDGGALPFQANRHDAPAWEHDSDPAVERRLLHGYLDLLTWQSRRLRLMPSMVDGRLMATHVLIMKGNELSRDTDLRFKEQMVAYRLNEKAKPPQDPWPPLRFRAGRALWRDSLLLCQALPGRQLRPGTVEWVRDLAAELDESILPGNLVPMEAYGMVADQKNIVFWRRERLALPLPYFSEPRLQSALGEALDVAEKVAGALRFATRKLAEASLSPNGDLPGGRQPDPKAMSSLGDHLDPRPAYWSKVHLLYGALLADLAADRCGDDGETRYGESVLPRWREDLRRAARDAFADVTNNMDASARNLKASALAERVLNEQLYLILDQPATPDPVTGAPARKGKRR